jgi:tetratricopeptide (TPR) repeat protein
MSAAGPRGGGRAATSGGDLSGARALYWHSLIAAASLALAACAPAPTVVDDPPPAVSTPSPSTFTVASPYRNAAIARHSRLAAAARDAGDLAEAADHEEVLVLLAPNDPARRRALQTTREAIKRTARTHAESGLAARRSGDLVAARDSYLRVLVLDPDNTDAVKALREIDSAVMARSQGERAAKVRVVDDIVTSAKARASDALDVDQRIEIMRAGDLNAGLRELRSWVDANPGDRATRQRIGAAVAEKARELEAKAQRESALGLYEQAGTLAGAAMPEWTTRAQALRKALGEHYYAQGMKVYRTDLASAIRSFEAGARYDPNNTTLQLRLREAKLAQEKLQKIRK